MKGLLHLLKTTLFLSLPFLCQSQSNLNMELQDSLYYPIGVNDVVGWADDDGNEYAIVGVLNGVSIVNVDETPIRQVSFIPGAFSGWRDINTYSHYAYVVSEANIGLLIIDLQYLPDSVKTYVWEGELPEEGKFRKAHTIWVDDDGLAYFNGSNANDGGVVIMDVATDPLNPTFLGYGPPIYAHDVYSRDSILYSAEIYRGAISIYDIHDPANVIPISSTQTPNEFTHNAWLSDDSRYLYTTDERTGSFVTSYDISDPENPIEVDRFRQATTGGSTIPHNVYVWNDWIVVAYYSNGTLILDGAHPDNLIEVGNFDSFLGPDGDFEGVWGSYPFLPSGKILSSDRENGLFVFQPNYVRAAYLEGIVLDATTHEPIWNAVIRIISDEVVPPELSGTDGTFKTGKAIPGTFDVLVEKEGYYSQTLQLNFVNGQLLDPVIELLKRETYVYSGKVIDDQSSNVPDAKVILVGEHGIYETNTDAEGNFILPEVNNGSYHVQAGIWGKTIETDIELDNSTNVTLQLIDGYTDDFDLDLGWTVSGDAIEGEWARGIPTHQIFDKWTCGPGSDSPFDVGAFAYSTGLSNTEDVTNDEVSGGTTYLVSPPMDLDSIPVIHIRFDYWLCEYPPNQYIGFNVWMTDGVDTALLAEYSMDSNFLALAWRRELIIVDEWNGSRENIQILFSASDTTGGISDYTLKVLVDNFKVGDALVSTEDDKFSAHQLVVYPNPVSTSQLYLKLEGEWWEAMTINITDLQGRKISNAKLSRSGSVTQITHHLEEGIYFLQWETDQGHSGIEKILVLK